MSQIQHIKNTSVIIDSLFKFRHLGEDYYYLVTVLTTDQFTNVVTKIKRQFGHIEDCKGNLKNSAKKILFKEIYKHYENTR